MISKTAMTFSFLLVLSAQSSLAQYAHKLEQGWTEQEALVAYHQNEGSQIMPLKWFLNLEVDASGAKLIDQASKFGLVSDPVNPLTNPYGLPIGMSSVEDIETGKLYGEKAWVGVNCTACHSGMIQIQGHNVFLDGGSSLFHIQKLEKAILDSVQETIQIPDRLDRLAVQLKSNNKQELKNNLILFQKEFGSWVSRNHRFLDTNQVEVPYGVGRMDGLGGGTNDLTCHMTDRLGDEKLKTLLTDPRNCRDSQPAVALPHLWGMTEMQFVQWNGAVHVSLGRNYGQATATYGKNWIEQGLDGKPSYRSTANPKGLYILERLFDKLKSPSWNELVKIGLSKPIDLISAKRGETLYKENCVGCHSINPQWSFPNAFGNSYWKVSVIPTDIVKTDDLYLKTISSRKAFLPAPLKSKFIDTFSEQKISDNLEVLAADFRALGIGSMIKEDFKLNKLSLPQQAKLTNCRSLSLPQPIVGMKARSLEGVILTAPYLHNNSIPTLWDLLTPEKDRPKTFYVGCRNYDLEKMGYVCDAQSENTELFDTRLAGNSNSGHNYGTTFSDEMKHDLIEFLKSLEQPANPLPKNPICN